MREADAERLGRRARMKKTYRSQPCTSSEGELFFLQRVGI